MRQKPHHKDINALNAYKDTLTLTDKQHQILHGTLLGDLYIRPTGKNSCLNFGQKNKEYIFHLYDNFEEWVLTPPTESIEFYETAQKKQSTKSCWRLQTISHKAFQTYREKFYPQGKKILTPENLDFLFSSPVVLAYWFMDDGSKHSNYAYKLHTSGFSLEENQELVLALERKFQLKTTIQGTKYKYLYIPADSKQKFKELIEPHIISSMHYKL